MKNLENERMTDFVLVSLDGERVLASKFILGARSPVFRRQLFAGAPSPDRASFATQQNNNTLKVGYSWPVVQGLVEYCRSDDIRNFVSLLHCGKSVRDLVHMFECAEYYELPGLAQRVCATAAAVCKISPHLAAALFDESCKSAAVQISQISKAVIREEPRKALLSSNAEGLDFGVPTCTPGVSYLRVDALREILQDAQMRCDEIVLFHVLVAWVATQNDSEDGDESIASIDCWDMDEGCFEPPFEIAKKLGRHIDLAKIPPSELLSTVTDSGLIPYERIIRALGEIALLVEKEGTYHVNRRRDAAGVGANYIYQHKLSASTSSPSVLLATPPRSSHSQNATKQVASISLDDDLAQGVNNISFEDTEVETSDDAANSILDSGNVTPPRANRSRPSSRQRAASRLKRRKQHEAASSRTRKPKDGFVKQVKQSLNFIANSTGTLCAAVCNDPRSKPDSKPLNMQWHNMHWPDNKEQQPKFPANNAK